MPKILQTPIIVSNKGKELTDSASPSDDTVKDTTVFFQNTFREDDGFPDSHPGPDHRPSPDAHIRTDLGGRVDLGRRVDEDIPFDLGSRSAKSFGTFVFIKT